LISASEKLASTERHLDVSKGHSVRTDDKTDELKKLNRSIFRPAITFNKDAKRAAQDAKLQSRYDEEREEREKAMMDIRESHNRLGQAAGYGRGGDNEEDGIGGAAVGRGRYKTEQQLAEKKSARQRYQFEATGSDDELEDELDDNLDEMSSGLKSLKALSLAMGQELGEQNTRIGRIEQKTVGLDDRLARNTERVRSELLLLTFDTKSIFPVSSRRLSDQE
jgi:protein transport protein SEC9